MLSTCLVSVYVCSSRPETRLFAAQVSEFVGRLTRPFTRLFCFAILPDGSPAEIGVPGRLAYLIGKD